MPRPLVIALHGSEHPGAAALADELVTLVGAELPGVQVSTAWVDARARAFCVDQLPVPELVEGEPVEGELVEGGLVEGDPVGGPTVVVPAFLTAGYHVLEDLPALVDGGVLTTHVGPDLLDAVADRVIEVEGPGDAILLAAAGSKHAEARAEVEAAASELGVRFGVPVRVGYLYGDGASIEAAAAALIADGARDVTVATYFLADGLYTARLQGLPVARLSRPIGAHPVLVDAIVQRYAHSVGTTDPLNDPAPLGAHRLGFAGGSAPSQQGCVQPVTAQGAEEFLAGVPAPEPYLLGLHLNGRRVVVAGAGAVASRRIPQLLDAGARIEVVAADASEQIRTWATTGRLTWTPREVTTADVDGAWFVLAATSDPEANALVARAAEARRIFCVRADDVDAGTARTPATGRSADLRVGVLSDTPNPRHTAAARTVAVEALDAWASGKEQP